MSKKSDLGGVLQTNTLGDEICSHSSRDTDAVYERLPTIGFAKTEAARHEFRHLSHDKVDIKIVG